MEMLGSSFIYLGYLYKEKSSKEDKVCYKCLSCDSMACRARLVVNGHDVRVKGTHICQEFLPLSNSETADEEPLHYIERFIFEKSMQLELFPSQIYKDLLISLTTKFLNDVYTIPSKNYIYSEIRENRKYFSLNPLNIVMMSPLGYKRNGQPFFRRYWNGDVDGVYHQLIIWATNETLSLMRYNSHTFIDCSFRTVPEPFVQCVIIMVYDQGTRSFIPCAYALLTGKSERLYGVLLYQLIVLMEYEWKPSLITADFQVSLLSAIRHEVTGSRLLGCCFHLKHAVCKKLHKYEVKSADSSIIMSNIELLTVIPIEKIQSAISYIKNLVSDHPNCTRFWQYFANTWLTKYDPSIYNNFKFGDNGIINGMNNAIEQYHQRLNEQFSSPHPSIATFALVIRQEFQFFEENLSEIRQNLSGIVHRCEPYINVDVISRFQSYLETINS